LVGDGVTEFDEPTGIVTVVELTLVYPKYALKIFPD
jgi:hypothetical protein